MFLCYHPSVSNWVDNDHVRRWMLFATPGGLDTRSGGTGVDLLSSQNPLTGHGIFLRFSLSQNHAEDPFSCISLDSSFISYTGLLSQHPERCFSAVSAVVTLAIYRYITIYIPLSYLHIPKPDVYVHLEHILI